MRHIHAVCILNLSPCFTFEPSTPLQPTLDCITEYLPPATLSLKSGEPVINIDGSVVLELLVEEKSLFGWCCWVYKGGKVHRIKLKKSLTTNQVLTFQPYKLKDNIAIYWCSDETNLRSTPLTIKTSGKTTIGGCNVSIISKELWDKYELSNSCFGN